MVLVLKSAPSIIHSNYSSQPHLLRLERRLRAIQDAEFAEDVGHVVFHGSFGNVTCDFLVAFATNQVLENCQAPDQKAAPRANLCVRRVGMKGG